MKKSDASDSVDWTLALDELAGAFPGASLGEIVEQAEAAADEFDASGASEMARKLRRAADIIRKRAEH